MVENRMARLKAAINAATNDDARYALGDKVREMGYLNVADFAASRPPVEHMQIVEGLLGMGPAS